MMNGIDISSWQAGIDISKLTTTEFVIVKATGGTAYTNPYFIRHMEATLATGKLAGAYHYAREKGCKGSAKAEAAYFCGKVKDYIGKIVLVLDWEEELSLGPAWALEWLQEVERLTGVKPLIYTGQSVCASRSYDWSAVAKAGYKLWLAQYPNYNQTDYKNNPWRSGGIGAFPGYIMHQYTSSGRIAGYDGNLDLNLFYGSADDWTVLAGAKNMNTEDDDMTGEQIYKRLNEYLATQPVPDWAREEVQEAIDAGITDGSDMMQLIPRYQAAIMAKRALSK